MYSFSCLDANGGPRNYYRTASKETICVLGPDGKEVLQCPEDVDYSDTVVVIGGDRLRIDKITLSDRNGWEDVPPATYRWWLEFEDGTRAMYSLRPPAKQQVYRLFPERGNGEWVSARSIRAQVVMWHPRVNKYGTVLEVRTV